MIISHRWNWVCHSACAGMRIPILMAAAFKWYFPVNGGDDNQ